MPTREDIAQIKKEHPGITFRELGLIFKVSHVRIIQIYNGVKKTEEYKMRKRHESHMLDSRLRTPCRLCEAERKSLVTPLHAVQYAI